MNTLITMVVAYVATVMAIYFLRPLCPRIGLVDHPDDHRKHHTEPTPLCGGLGIGLGFFISLLVTNTSFVGVSWTFLLAFLPLLIVGVWDDITEIPWWIRISAQILSALLMVYIGQVSILHVGDLIQPGHILNLGTWAVPLTVFSVVGIINGINMLDGLDGLAGGVVFVALGWFTTAAFLQGAGVEAAFILVLMAAIAGFMAFNFRFKVGARALVFLGDSGSTILGFALGWVAILLSQMQSDGLPPMSVIWIIGLPLFDAVTQILRRLIDGRSPMSPDRNHLHHMLLRRGLTDGQTVVVMLFVALAFGAVGVGGWRAGVPTPVMFWGFLALYCVYLTVVAFGHKLAGGKPQ